MLSGWPVRKNSCVRAKEYLKDSISNGVLFEFRNLKKPLGLLKDYFRRILSFNFFPSSALTK